LGGLDLIFASENQVWKRLDRKIPVFSHLKPELQNFVPNFFAPKALHWRALGAKKQGSSCRVFLGVWTSFSFRKAGMEAPVSAETGAGRRLDRFLRCKNRFGKPRCRSSAVYVAADVSTFWTRLFRSGRKSVRVQKLRHRRFGPVLRCKTGLEVRALLSAHWRGIGPVLRCKTGLENRTSAEARFTSPETVQLFGHDFPGVAGKAFASKKVNSLRYGPVLRCKTGMEVRALLSAHWGGIGPVLRCKTGL